MGLTTVLIPKSRGHLVPKRIPGTARRKVSADGEEVVGAVMLREVAERAGLVGGLTVPLLASHKGLPTRQPGGVLTDLTVAVAYGAINISGIQTLTGRQEMFGAVTSMLTVWRVLDRVTEERLPAIRKACAQARATALVHECRGPTWRPSMLAIVDCGRFR